MGAVERGEQVTEGTLTKFGRFSPEKVLSWCASCQIHLGETLAELRRPVFDLDRLTTFLAERLNERKRKFIKPVEK
ncbi:MAG: hypothetical protein ACE5NC_07775 [Anaerolineae bacterium]